MSAYVEDKVHIDLLVRAALEGPRGYFGYGGWGNTFVWYSGRRSDGTRERHELTEANVNEIGQMLLDTNVASVRFRYPDSELTDLPGRIDAEYVLPYEYRTHGYRLSLLEALNAIEGYEYQSCEHDDWDGSVAEAFCQALKERLINRLEGIDATPWSWAAETVKERKVAV